MYNRTQRMQLLFNIAATSASSSIISDYSLRYHCARLPCLLKRCAEFREIGVFLRWLCVTALPRVAIWKHLRRRYSLNKGKWSKFGIEPDEPEIVTRSVDGDRATIFNHPLMMQSGPKFGPPVRSALGNSCTPVLSVLAP